MGLSGLRLSISMTIRSGCTITQVLGTSTGSKFGWRLSRKVANLNIV